MSAARRSLTGAAASRSDADARSTRRRISSCSHSARSASSSTCAHAAAAVEQRQHLADPGAELDLDEHRLTELGARLGLDALPARFERFGALAERHDALAELAGVSQLLFPRASITVAAEHAHEEPQTV